MWHWLLLDGMVALKRAFQIDGFPDRRCAEYTRPAGSITLEERREYE